MDRPTAQTMAAHQAGLLRRSAIRLDYVAKELLQAPEPENDIDDCRTWAELIPALQRIQDDLTAVAHTFGYVVDVASSR